MPPIDEAAPTGLQVTFEGSVLKVIWTAASIPGGYSVVITVTDEQDRPLSPPPDIVISGTAANVSGPAIQPHTTLKVRLQALSPAAGPETIQLIALATPAAPSLSFSAAGLDISWNSIEGATGYEVEAADGAGKRLDPQPSITRFGPDDPRHASIAGGSLLDRTTYQLRVRASAGGSHSLWSDPSKITIDKSQPESALLRALLARLQAAGANFNLGPDVIRSGRVTGQFASLLNAAAGTLAVRNASVSSTPTSVTLTATLDLFHVAGATGVFVFSDRKAIVELDLSYPLGNCTVAQLKTAGLLPADAFGNTAWADGIAALEQVLLHLDTASDKVTLTTAGDGAAWSVLGLPGVKLGAVKPQLEVYAPLNTRLKRYVPRVLTEIDLGSAGKLPVYLQLPAGYTPWQVGLARPWYAGNLTSIYALFGGRDLSLPDGLVSLGQLTLDALTVTHTPNGSTWSWDVAATLGPIPGDNSSTTPRWQIIAGVLELERLSAALRVDVISTSTGFVTSSAGAVAARFTLGTLDPFEAVLRVPGVNGKWTLSVATSRSIALAQTSQLLKGDTTALDTALTRVGTTSGFTLEGLDVEFMPAVPELTQFSIAISINAWTVPSLTWFTVDRVRAQLSVMNPQQAASRIITGSLEAFLTLGSVQVGVVTSFDQSSVWKLRIGAQAARLSGLDDLERLVSAGTIAAQVPAKLPTSGGFEMGAFGFSYDSQQNYLTEIGFALRSGLDWEIVPGVFTLNDIDIQITGTQASAVAPMNYTGSIAGRITLAGARFLLSASKPNVGTPWKLRGELEDGITLDFNALLHEHVSPDVSIPTGHGFPTGLTILAAEASLIPDTGAFDFSGDALMEWSFDFGAATFAVRSLGGSIHRDPDPKKSTGTLYGTFDFGPSLTGDASIRLGEGDTIIQVAVQVPADPTKLDAATFADQLTGASAPVPVQGAVPLARTIPSGLNTQLTGVAVSVNLTQGEYLLTGKVAGMWSYLFYRDKTQPEYLFAVGFGPDFTFKGLVPALEPVDSIIKVSDARMVVYNVVEATGLAGIQTAVTALGNQDAAWPLPDVTGITLPPQKGLLVSARIQLNAPALFANVVQIGSMGNSTVQMLGVIDLGTTNNSFFAASLPDITLFNSVTFTGVQITFTPKNQQITLAAGVVFPDIFAKSFGFSGRMTLDSDKMSGELSLLPNNPDTKITTPFDLPGIVIDQLSLGVDYTFARPAQGSKPARAKSSQFSLQGDVVLGRAPQRGGTDDRIHLAGKLALVDGAPALVYVAVHKDFSVGRFLAQCITGSGANWPSNFIDLEFLSGTRIYYYKKAADPGNTLATYEGKALNDGYHIDAHFRVTLVFKITLHAVIDVLQDDAGKYVGISAALALDAPLDLDFVELAGPKLPAPDAPKYTGGPQLGIITGKRPSFTVNTGINFLGSAFGAVKVIISKPAGGQTQFDGEMTAAKPLAPFGRLEKLGFTYIVRADGNNTLRIKDWPAFKWAADLVDFVQAIKNLCNTADNPDCEQLADMIVQNAFDQTFSFNTPSVASEGDDLVFSLSGTCTLKVQATGTDILTMTSPPLDIRIPKTTTYHTLPGALASGIAGASASFARDLLSQPHEIAKFLAIVFAEKAAAVALKLVCYRITDAAVTAATAAGADALAAAGGVAGAGAVAAAASAVGRALSDGSSSSSSSSSGASTAPQTPTLKTLVYASGGFAASWDAASFAAGYVFEVLNPDTTSLGLNTYGLVLSGGLTADAAQLPAGTFQGRVKSTRGNQASAWSTKPIVKPAPPTLVLDFDGSGLNATWSDLGFDGYVVQFFDPQGDQLAGDRTITAAPFDASVVIADPVAGAYTARGQSSKTGGIPGDWGASVSLEILTLPAPANLTLIYADGKLTASWDTGAESGVTYVVFVRTGETTVAAKTSDAGSVELTPDEGQSYQDGTTYTVTVRARSANAMSPWSTGTITVAQLAAPAGLQVDMEGHALQAHWQAVNGEANYEAQVLDSAGQPLTTQPPITYAGATARVDASSLQEGQTYQLRVRAAAPQNLGAWGAPVSLRYQPVPTPTDFSVGYDGLTIHASWNVVESAMLAMTDFEVLDEQGRPLDPQPARQMTMKDAALSFDKQGNATTSGINSFTADISGAGIVAGATFQLHVRASTPAARSDWSAPLAVNILPAPTGLQLSATPNVIAAQWQAVAGAGGYEAQALDASGEPLAAQPPVRYDGTNAHVDSSALQNGTTYQVQVRALDLPNRGPWGAPASVTASVLLPAPAGLTLRLSIASVIAQWGEVPGASAYTVLVLDHQDRPLDPQPNFAMSSVPAAVGLDEHGNYVTLGTATFAADISGTGIVAGAQIKVQVKGTSANADGTFCTPVAITLAFLAAPTITGTSVQGSNLIVTWGAVDGATGYDAIVLDAGGRQLGTQPPITYSGTTATADATNLPSGTYLFEVRANGGSLVSPYSAPASVVLAPRT